MDKFFPIEIVDRLKLAGFLGFFALFFSYFAIRLRFFRLHFPTNSGLPALKYPLSVLAIYLFIFFLATPLVFSLFSFFFPEAKNILMQSPLLAIGMIQVSTFFFSVILLLFFALLQKKGDFSAILFGPNKRKGRTILFDLGIGVSTWLISFPVTALFYQTTEIITYWIFGSFGKEQVAVSLLRLTRQSPYIFTITLFSILIAAPIIEEILFRGILQTYLKYKLGFKFALPISSLFFALLHVAPAQGITNIALVSSLFVFSLYLGFLYERQRSLLSSIALHMTFNSINVIRILLLKP